MEKEMCVTQKQSVRTDASALSGQDMQDVRQFLRGVRHSYLYTQTLCERAERYRQMAMRSTSRTDAVRLGGTPQRSKVETYVLELMDVHEQLKRKVDALLDQSRRAEQLISLLRDDRHRTVLQFRYLCGMTYDEIAEKLGYTLRWTHKLHSSALSQLEQICQRKAAPQNKTL